MHVEFHKIRISGIFCMCLLIAIGMHSGNRVALHQCILQANLILEIKTSSPVCNPSIQEQMQQIMNKYKDYLKNIPGINVLFAPIHNEEEGIMKIFTLMKDTDSTLRLIRLLRAIACIEGLSCDVHKRIYDFLICRQHALLSYEYIEYLGAGAHGIVFRVKDPTTKEQRALKLTLCEDPLPGQLSENPLRKRIMELQTNADCPEQLMHIYEIGEYTHPCIGQLLYGVGEYLDIAYEFRGGQSWNSFLEMDLSFAETIEIMRQYIHVNAYLTQKGIYLYDQEIAIFRDNNNMIKTKIVDFGRGKEAVPGRACMGIGMGMDIAFFSTFSAMSNSLVDYILFQIVTGAQFDIAQIEQIKNTIQTLNQDPWVKTGMIRGQVRVTNEIYKLLLWFYSDAIEMDKDLQGDLSLIQYNDIVAALMKCAGKDTLKTVLLEKTIPFFQTSQSHSCAPIECIAHLLCLVKARYSVQSLVTAEQIADLVTQETVPASILLNISTVVPDIRALPKRILESA